MKRSFSIGRAIALLIALTFVFFVWGVVFAPGGSGSNIVLGIVIAVILVSSITKRLGDYFDEVVFHGGNRRRAAVYRRASVFFNTNKQDLKAWASKNKKELNQKEYIVLSESLSQLDSVLDDVAHNWRLRDMNEFDAQIKNMTSAMQKVETASNDLWEGANKRTFSSEAMSLALMLIAALGIRAMIAEPYQIPSGSMIPTLLVGDHLFVWKLKYGILNPLSKDPSYIVRWSSPKPGEVVVFQAPDYVGRHGGQSWIKRVIAGPGQKIRIQNGVVYVDGQPYPHLEPSKLVNYFDFYDDADGGRWVNENALETIEQTGDAPHKIYMNTLTERHLGEADWPMPAEYRPRIGLNCTDDECQVQEGYIFVMGDNRGNSGDSRYWGGLPIQNVKGKAVLVWMSVDGSRRWIDLGRFVMPAFRFERWFGLIK